jgi:hypothetical protein
MFTSGAIVLVLSVLRITVIRLHETPKYLLGMGEDAKVVETLQNLAKKYNRPCSLTVEKLEACGVVRTAHSASRFSIDETLVHLRGLFCTRKIGLSTVLVWLSWTLIGLAYPLFYVFLYTYLASKGATFDNSTYTYWRDYALTNVTSIPGSWPFSLAPPNVLCFFSRPKLTCRACLQARCLPDSSATCPSSAVVEPW